MKTIYVTLHENEGFSFKPVRKITGMVFSTKIGNALINRAKNQRLKLCSECLEIFQPKRRTQVMCGKASCRDKAQRRYSLNWWNNVGANRRKEKGKINESKD